MKIKSKNVIITCPTSESKEKITYSGAPEDVEKLRFWLPFEKGYAGHSFDLDFAFPIDIMVACQNFDSKAEVEDPPKSPSYPDGVFS